MAYNIGVANFACIYKGQPYGVHPPWFHINSGKKIKTSTYKAEEELLEEIDSSLFDSSNWTWHVETEVSPSSYEYLLHYNTPTKRSDIDFESEVVEEVHGMEAHRQLILPSC